MKWKDEDGFLAQIKNEERFGIFLDMGTGKTSLTLALIDHKFFVENYKKVLIITPKAVSPIRFKLLSDSNKKLLTILLLIPVIHFSNSVSMYLISLSK